MSISAAAICTAVGLAAGGQIYCYWYWLYPYGSILRSIIYPTLIRILTSEATRTLLWKLEWAKAGMRAILGAAPSAKSNTSMIFISLDDPQSYMLLQCIKVLRGRYNVNFEIKILSPGVCAYYDNNRDNQRSWLLRDCQVFAYIYNNTNFKCYNNDCKCDNNHTSGGSQSTSFQFIAPMVTSTLPCDNSILTLITKDIALLGSIVSTDSKEFLDDVLGIFNSLWVSGDYQLKVADLLQSRLVSGEIRKASQHFDAELYLKSNLELLGRVGYFGPGVVSHYGELYTLHRLHHLERRLLSQGLGRVNVKRIYFDLELDRRLRLGLDYEVDSAVEGDRSKLCRFLRSVYGVSIADNGKEQPYVKLFYSFRSPYSQIILERVQNLIRFYNSRVACENRKIALEIKAMMPMVMRGLPVSFDKAKYIAMDCAREARLHGIDFGCICDPIYPDGKPVMRALSGFVVAKRLGKEVGYLLSFAKNVWCRGKDAGTDLGFKTILTDAGIDCNLVLDGLQLDCKTDSSPSWKEETSKNMEALYKMGLWGVPSISFGTGCGEEVIVWGQDKFWVMEELVLELQRQNAAHKE